MAKRSQIVADARRRQLVVRYAQRRAELKAAIRNGQPGSDEVREAVQAFARLPRDASPTRVRNRCHVDGRSRGYLGITGTSRIRFRLLAHEGALPGIRKSSW